MPSAGAYTAATSRAGDAGVLAPQLPAWLEERLPGWAVERFLRVREMELDNPDNETLRYALSQKAMQRLHIGGGTYDVNCSSNCVNCLCCKTCASLGARVDARGDRRYCQLQTLQSLNLMRTNITAQGVHALGQLPHLRSLNLIHTDVWLHELGRPLSPTILPSCSCRIAILACRPTDA